MPTTHQKAAPWPFTLQRGNSWPQDGFTLQDSTGALVADYTPTVLIKRALSDPDDQAIKTMTVASGDLVKTGATTTFSVTAKVDLPIGSCFVQILVTLSNNQVFTLYAGSVTVNP
jgi:hypothetical protein